MRLTGLVPMLQTNDMPGTRRWYEEVLGFQCTAEAGDHWCRLQRDDVAIMFMRNAHLGEPHATATQYVYVDEILAFWESIKDRCEPEWGPQDMPYGLKEFAIRDPNGYLLSFGGRPREDQSTGRAAPHA